MIKAKYLNTLPKFQTALLLFFVFGSLFPTLRILLIGSETSKNILEYIISGLFDLTAISIIAYSLIHILKKRLISQFTYFDWIVLMFILSNTILGTILSQDFMLSIYGFRMTYLPAFFYFVLRFNDFKFNLIETLFSKIYHWFFFVAIIGLVLYFGFYSTMIDMIYRSGGIVNNYFITRMTSVFWSPVIFASFMTLSFLYFYYRITNVFKQRNYILLSIFWLCILLSVSRGALIILFFGLLILTILSGKWKTLGYLFLIMITLFFCISFYIASPLEFITWIIKSSSDTLNLEKGVTRVDLWIKAFADFKERPFGFGLGKAGHVATRFFGKHSTLASVSSTDGWFLKIAGETGLWGLATYLTLAIAFFTAGVKFIKTKTYGIFHFLFVLFIVVNIQCIVSNVIDFYLLSYLFWLSLGLAENIKSKGSIQ